MLKDLFGEARLCDVRVSDIRLPRHPVDAKKVKSLVLKYHAIPEEFQDHYPQVEAEEVIEESPVEQSWLLPRNASRRRSRPRQVSPRRETWASFGQKTEEEIEEP